MKTVYSVVLSVVGAVLMSSAAYAYEGKLVDAKTNAPIERAAVVLGDQIVRTNKEGIFQIDGNGDTLKVRAPGYAKQEIPLSSLGKEAAIAMVPFKVKALYLSSYGIASRSLRNAALETLKTNNMNALVIDFKGDRAFIPFKVDIPLAQDIGAQNRILVKDSAELISMLKQKNVYLIARIVVFKDDLLAGAKPGWSIKKNGDVFRDREKLRWIDPFNQDAWAYNIEIAKAAAKMGFDEVQFDYVRFPDTKGIQFSEPSNRTSRTKAITGFLNTAYKELAPYNVMVGADIFGYVAWNTDDTGIGQDIKQVTNAVDVVSLMLYPSGFQFGIPNYANPIQHSYEIVKLSLKRAQERTQMPSTQFRPWLQAFRDYAFNGGDFAAERMNLQAKAAHDSGSSGYMFWNPRNVYARGEMD